MTRGHRDSLRLRCRAFSSPSPCRFIPALSPAVHPDLAALAAFAVADQDRAASRSRSVSVSASASLIRSPARQRITTSAQPCAVHAGACGTHDRDDLLDRRRIGGVAPALIARHAPASIPSPASDADRPRRATRLAYDCLLTINAPHHAAHPKLASGHPQPQLDLDHCCSGQAGFPANCAKRIRGFLGGKCGDNAGLGSGATRWHRLVCAAVLSFPHGRIRTA